MLNYGFKKSQSQCKANLDKRNNTPLNSLLYITHVYWFFIK